MSEAKELGVVGQKYENRKTSVVGILRGRDIINHQLIFSGDNGESFNVSNSNFHSYWRKAKDVEVPVDAPVEVDIAKAEPAAVDAKMPKPRKKVSSTTTPVVDTAPVVTFKPIAPIAGTEVDEVITNFLNVVGSAVTAEYERTANLVTLHKDGFDVVTIDMSSPSYLVKMFPDVYSFSAWSDVYAEYSLTFDAKAELSVSLCVKRGTSLGTVLAVVAEAIRELNLYGYGVDDEDEGGEE